MNVLYIVGTGSRWQDNELRYSLRSLERFAVDLDRVFIIGHIPDFINRDEVTCCDMEDPTCIPHYNVWDKLLHAVSIFNLGASFILSSDDHFLLRETSLKDTPIFYKGPHLPSLDKLNHPDIGSNDYIHTLNNTRMALESYGLPTKFFEGHRNKLIRKDALMFLYNIGFLQWVFHTPQGVTIGSPIAAATMYLHPLYPCVRLDDTKVQRYSTIDELKNILDNAHGCFSIGDNAILSGIGDILPKLYPHPSRFEKN